MVKNKTKSPEIRTVSCGVHAAAAATVTEEEEEEIDLTHC